MIQTLNEWLEQIPIREDVQMEKRHRNNSFTPVTEESDVNTEILLYSFNSC